MKREEASLDRSETPDRRRDTMRRSLLLPAFLNVVTPTAGRREQCESTMFRSERMMTVEETPV
jgi:hypothetical protein